MADLKELADRIKREGELTRNDGKNSLGQIRHDVQNVAEHIHVNMQELIKENENIGKLYEKQIGSMEGQRYDLLESVREQKKANDINSNALKESNKPAPKSKDSSGSGMFKNLFTFLGASKIFTKLGKFLKFGGPIGAAVASGLFLFDVFKKVGEDPRFVELKDKFRIFKDRIKEDTKRISDALDLKEIPEGYFTDKIFSFGSNATTQVADMIIEIADTLLDPNKSFMQKFKDTIDSAITNTVQLMKPDAFGDDGSFVKSIERGINDLGKQIVMSYNNAGLVINKVVEKGKLNQLMLAGKISKEEYEKRINELDFKFRNREQIKSDLEKVDKYLSGNMSNAESNIFTASSKFKKLFEKSPTGLYEYMSSTMTPAEIEAFLNSDNRESLGAFKREFEMQRNMFNNILRPSSLSTPDISVAGTLENLIQSGDFGNITNIIQDNSSSTSNNQGGGTFVGSDASPEDFYRGFNTGQASLGMAYQ
jgi:hypothetical protein